MEDRDRVTLGWSPWMTPRQIRIITEALRNFIQKEDEIDKHKDLLEWFESELVIKKQKISVV